jgi:hypothetical protein
MKKLLAVFLALHGLAHLVGVMTAWKLLEPEGGYPTALLDGRWEVGSTVMAVSGVFWLLGAGAFLVAAYALVAKRTWALPAVATAATYSLVLSAVHWPEAHIGVYINAALGIAIVVSRLRALELRPPRAA